MEPVLSKMEFSSVEDNSQEKRKTSTPVDILGGLYNHRWLLLLAVLLGVISGILLAGRKSKPMYSSEGTILFEAQLPQLLYPSERARMLDSFSAWMKTQNTVIKSYPIMEEAIRKYENEGFRWQRSNEAFKTSMDRLKSVLILNQARDTQILNFSLISDDREGVARLINIIIETYIAFRNRVRVDEDFKKLEYLKKEEDRYEQLLEESYLELEMVSAKYGAAIVDPQNYGVYLQSLASLKGAYNDVVLNRIRSENRFKALQEQRMRLLDLDISGLEGSELLQKQEDELRTRMIGLEVGSREYAIMDSLLNHIQQTKLDLIARKMVSELSIEIETFRTEFHAAKEDQAGVKRELAKKEQEILEFNAAVLRAATKRNEIERIEDVITRLSERIEQITIESNNPGRIFVQSWALPPAGPDPVSPVKKFGFGFIVWLFFGVSIALARTFMDKTLKRPSDIQKAFGFPATGFVLHCDDDNIPAKDMYRVFGTHHKSYLYELIHKLSVHFAKDKQDHNSTVFSLMAVKQAEGTSTIALNVLASLDAAPERKLYIDMNDRVPLSEKLIELKGEPGISDWMANPGGFREYVHYDLGFPMGILPLGTHTEDNSQVINFQNFKNLILELREEFDYIFLDCPPLLLSSQANKLAMMGDVVVVIVEANKTQWPEIFRAVNLLERLKVRALSMVVNKVRVLERGYYHSLMLEFYGKSLPPRGLEKLRQSINIWRHYRKRNSSDARLVKDSKVFRNRGDSDG
ncbi:MAG: GumC family protein [Calditrichia bacterium]